MPEPRKKSAAKSPLLDELTRARVASSMGFWVGCQGDRMGRSTSQTSVSVRSAAKLLFLLNQP